jgi:Tol biopolymer transport system component/DNA-binding winged helix-turn-helix (wHTH) protein
VIEENRQVYEFDEFRLDVTKRQLLREDEVVPLYSKAFDLLLLLVRSSGQDLSKDEILESIWPGQILEESNLTVNISAVRRALGEKAAQPRFLVTIPGRGYRFVANVHEVDFHPDGVLIATETISQVVVEEELDAGDSDTSIDPDMLRGRQPKQLVGVPPRGFFRRPFAITGLALAAVAIIVTVSYGIHAFRSSRAATHFSQIKMRQLTNDGQIVSAAISPDGKFYAYTNLQGGMESLHLGSVDGQTSIELREPGLVTYHDVAFAPDGRSIYYVMENDDRTVLYRLPTLGGVPVKLREDVPWFFSIAPDNQRIAFLRYVDGGKNTSVVISNVDGANERTVLTAPITRNMTTYCLAWSPDGSLIALGASRENDPSVCFMFLLSIDSGQLKQLSTVPWKTMGRISWLKDGTGILTIAAAPGPDEGSQIWMVAYPGGEVRRVVNDLNTYDFTLDVAADSSTALTSTHRQINNVWVAPANELRNSKQVTYGSLNRTDGLLGLDWTPDNKIVYTSANAQGGTIWIMNSDGSNRKELTPPGSDDTVPSVTGDGRLIVFLSHRSGGNEIWRTNIDGSEPKQLTKCGKNFDPTVSPDGKWVVYRSDCDGGRLWRVDINGGESQRLSNNAASWPWISPDSRLIACQYATDDGKTQLAVLSIDGGPPIKLFDIPPQANFRYAIRWTADGKAITYRDWGKGLWRQPLEGGPPQRLTGLPDEKIYSNGWSRDGKMFAFTRGVEMRDVILISNAK